MSLPTPSPSGAPDAGQILGCAVSFGRLPVGVRTWLARRWFEPVGFESVGCESGLGLRDYTLRLQTATDAPEVLTWRQQPRRDKVLQLLGQQVTVGQVRQDTPAHAPTKVRIETQGTVVWLDLHDRHATLTLDHAHPDDPAHPDDHAHPDSTNSRHLDTPDINPDIPDINLAAAERGVWQGKLSPYPLVIGLHEALRCAGWIPIHGACAHVDGAAVLFLGASGTGKTTTLMRALQAGWGFVAEDVLWVDAHTLAVRSLETGVRLFAAEVASLEPRLADADLGELVMGKAFIAQEVLTDLYGSQPSKGEPSKGALGKGAPRLQHVVQLVRNQQNTPLSATPPSAWQALSKQQAAVALWQGLGMPLTPQVQQQVAGWLPRGLQQVNAWQLTLGDDVREVLAAGLPSETTTR